MEKQRSARAAALNKQLECGCPPPDSTGNGTGNGSSIPICADKNHQTTQITVPRKVTKSEAHTTTGRGRGGHRRGHLLQHQRLQQQNHENAQQVQNQTYLKIPKNHICFPPSKSSLRQTRLGQPQFALLILLSRLFRIRCLLRPEMSADKALQTRKRHHPRPQQRR